MQNNVYAINQEYGLQFTTFMVISLDHDIEVLKNKLGWVDEYPRTYTLEFSVCMRTMVASKAHKRRYSSSNESTGFTP